MEIKLIVNDMDLQRALGHSAHLSLERDRKETETLFVGALYKAMITKSKVQIGYIAASTHQASETGRIIAPTDIYQAGNGHWIVTAHCYKRGELRAFRVDRITRVFVLDGKFDETTWPENDGKLPSCPRCGAPRHV